MLIRSRVQQRLRWMGITDYLWGESLVARRPRIERRVVLLQNWAMLLASLFAGGLAGQLTGPLLGLAPDSNATLLLMAGSSASLLILMVGLIELRLRTWVERNVKVGQERGHRFNPKGTWHGVKWYSRGLRSPLW